MFQREPDFQSVSGKSQEAPAPPDVQRDLCPLYWLTGHSAGSSDGELVPGSSFLHVGDTGHALPIRWGRVAQDTKGPSLAFMSLYTDDM